MAEVIPASGDDWRELARRASLPEGHVERVLLEIQQRLVPVEDRVLPVGAAAAADHVPDAGKLPTAMEISQEWLASYREDEARYDIKAFANAILAKWGNRPTPTAAPAGGVTVEEVAEMLVAACTMPARAAAHYILNHPRIGPLLSGEGGKRVADGSNRPGPGATAEAILWAAELARQQGEQP